MSGKFFDPATRPLVNRLWQEGQAMMSVLSAYELTAVMLDKDKNPYKEFY